MHQLDVKARRGKTVPSRRGEKKREKLGSVGEFWSEIYVSPYIYSKAARAFHGSLERFRVGYRIVRPETDQIILLTPYRTHKRIVKKDEWKGKKKRALGLEWKKDGWMSSCSEPRERKRGMTKPLQNLWTIFFFPFHLKIKQKGSRISVVIALLPHVYSRSALVNKENGKRTRWYDLLKAPETPTLFRGDKRRIEFRC